MQNPIAAIAGPTVIIGMQVNKNKMFQMTRVGIPEGMISLNLLGRLLVVAGVVAGVCFFRFKRIASLSKSVKTKIIYNKYYNEGTHILQVKKR